MAWGDPRWYFEDTQRTLDSLLEADPFAEHVREASESECAYVLSGRAVRWCGTSSYVVWVPADKILFMEGNTWGWGHARALYDLIESGANPLLEIPAGRLYRITPEVVASTQADYDKDELGYQRGMEKPYSAADAGTFWVQLVDGNHRAAAAIAAGEESIPVIVGENYRGDVRPEEWIDTAPPKRRRSAKKRRRNAADERLRRAQTGRGGDPLLEAVRTGQLIAPDPNSYFTLAGGLKAGWGTDGVEFFGGRVVVRAQPHWVGRAGFMDTRQDGYRFDLTEGFPLQGQFVRNYGSVLVPALASPWWYTPELQAALRALPHAGQPRQNPDADLRSLERQAATARSYAEDAALLLAQLRAGRGIRLRPSTWPKGLSHWKRHGSRSMPPDFSARTEPTPSGLSLAFDGHPRFVLADSDDVRGRHYHAEGFDLHVRADGGRLSDWSTGAAVVRYDWVPKKGGKKDTERLFKDPRVLDAVYEVLAVDLPAMLAEHDEAEMRGWHSARLGRS